MRARSPPRVEAPESPASAGATAQSPSKAANQERRQGRGRRRAPRVDAGPAGRAARDQKRPRHLLAPSPPRGPGRSAGPGPGRPRGPGHRGGRGAGRSRSPPRTQSGSAGARLTCSTGRRGPSRTIGPRSDARVTAQASRCCPAPPPPPPFPPARRRLVPAVRLLHSPGPGAACAAPRLRLDPSRRRLRRLRSARLVRSPRTARGNGAPLLGESHRRPRRPLRAPTLRSSRTGMRESL